MKRAVFLDRDGVINRAIVRDKKPYPPRTLNDLKILPGVLEALQDLHKAGWLLIVVTNQPDVSRGITNISDVEAINRYLMDSLPIDEIRTCYHDDQDICRCRKPMPGLLIAAAETHNINLSSSFMVGDRWRDIIAGNNAGCKTIFIDYGYDEQQPNEFNYLADSLFHASEIILGK
jgi:D-glycero-D-manno-heptose 1,7-bisphosphate phosphatase